MSGLSGGSDNHNNEDSLDSQEKYRMSDRLMGKKARLESTVGTSERGRREGFQLCHVTHTELRLFVPSFFLEGTTQRAEKRLSVSVSPAGGEIRPAINVTEQLI